MEAHLCLNADIIIICLLIPISLTVEDLQGRLREKGWALQDQACVLVGIEPSRSYTTSENDLKQGEDLAEGFGASAYIQCNVETGVGVDEVFEAVSHLIL